MTQEHPITPPPELIEDWIEITKPLPQRPPNPNELVTLAARWGADQELKACCALMDDWGLDDADLHFARRPKPPSKEEALDELHISFDRGYLKKEAADIIRRALESLPD